MAENISNKAVAAMMIVTVLVTVAGTLFFINGVDDFLLTSQRSADSGDVFLEVVSNDRPVAIQMPPGKGHVSLEIL